LRRLPISRYSVRRVSHVSICSMRSQRPQYRQTQKLRVISRRCTRLSECPKRGPQYRQTQHLRSLDPYGAACACTLAPARPTAGRQFPRRNHPPIHPWARVGTLLPLPVRSRPLSHPTGAGPRRVGARAGSVSAQIRARELSTAPPPHEADRLFRQRPTASESEGFAARGAWWGADHQVSDDSRSAPRDTAPQLSPDRPARGASRRGC
jgi:hypothetical protein